MRLCTLIVGVVLIGVGKVVSDLEVDLTCHELNMAATFDEERLKGEILEISITGCNADSYKVEGKKTVSVAFKDCAKTITEDESQIIQENQVAVVTGFRKPPIQRLVVNYFTLRCKFDRRLNVATSVAVSVKDKTEDFAEAKTTQFAAGMTVYESDKFVTVATDPFEVEAYGAISMEIKGLHNNDLFKFVTENCFATATGDPNDALKYNFFMEKCKLDDTFKELNPGTPNRFGFSIQAFTFIKVKKQVYFHCSLLICTKDSTSKECTQKCDNLNRRRKREISSDAVDEGGIERVVVRSGAIRWKSKRSVIA